MRLWKNVTFSLRFSILIIFISLFIITTLSIIIVRTVSYEDTLTFTSKALLRAAAAEIQHELTAGLNHAPIATEFSAKLISENVIPDDIEKLSFYIHNLVDTLTLAKGGFYGDKEGNYIYTEKEKGNITRIDVFNRRLAIPTRTTFYYDVNGNLVKKINSSDLSYDPRNRNWFQEAKAQQKTIWTNIFQLAEQNTLAIAAATPVMINNIFQGVFGIDVTLDYLITFLNEQDVSANGFSFVIDGKENLIAYPMRGPFKNMSSSGNTIINVHRDQALGLIDTAIDYFKAHKKKYFMIKYQNIKYIVNFLPVALPYNDEWLIGVIAPHDDFISHLQYENMLSLIVSGILLLLGIIIVSRLASRIVKPINQLAAETDYIKHFELDHQLNVETRISEVSRLAHAINSMKVNLKQFQKYVPGTLVRQLVESDQEMKVGGERKKLVVFFSDIQGFTTIAEETQPHLLTEQLCEYFEALSQIIIDEHGTIDKYIGDSIMAFWGAPLPEAAPCKHSARAALKCIQKVKELNAKWQDEGKPAFITRIGIHQGPAIVGNIGSSARLSYTAVGDTINLAQRLEDINKAYGTKIIVSESVYQRLKDTFILRYIDTVLVKGRTEHIQIYELIEEKGKG